jgi:CubicO group peptidase (beta-lactamase class C family)
MKMIILITMIVAALGTSTAAPSSRGEAPREVVHGALGTQIDDYLTRLSDLGFEETALVAKDGIVVLSKGYGLADRARGIPNTNRTVISIGSITKQFTGAAILKYEMQGKLTTQDPLREFFHDVPADKAGITLHQLLTHTSGLASDFGTGDYEKVLREQYVERIFHAPLLAPPGKEYHYSNAGYSLLAVIIELVSGRSYEEYLHDNLFVPAHMFHTGYVIPHWSTKLVAHQYAENVTDWGTPLDKPWARDGPYWLLRGNGGILSTVEDMYEWNVALSDERVLSREAIRKLETPYIPVGNSFYAYGWRITFGRYGKVVEHGGSDGIASACFKRYIDRQLVVYVASEWIAACELGQELTSIALGEPHIQPPRVRLQDRSVMNKYAGSYVLASGARLDVSVADRGLDVTPLAPECFVEIMGPGREGEGNNEQLRELDGRTADLLKNWARREYGPLGKAFGGNRSPDQISRAQDEIWDTLGKRLGGFLSFQILGTAPREVNTGLTTARLSFEKGVQYIQYIWRTNLDNIRLLERRPMRRFYPESSQDYVAFRVEDGSVHVTFELNAVGGVSGLVIRGKNGDIRASRE